mmetsp:Transcript_4631/g.16300  ORF Transcript_4631/g.16300 Transcript_4631/m.16300 type:complete len:255 (+) Transcript_4631:659-1423(+)
MGDEDEIHRETDGSIPLVLSNRRAYGEHEEDKPCHARLSPELEVKCTESWVQPCAHEEVVDHVARHAGALAHRNCRHIRDDGEDVGEDDAACGDCAQVDDDFGKADHLEVVECAHCGEGRVPAADAVAVVEELAVALGGHRQPLRHHSRHCDGEDGLERDEAEVDGCCVPGGRCAVRNVACHPPQEGQHVADAGGVRQVGAVVLETDPNVVHCDVREEHHHNAANWASELGHCLCIRVLYLLLVSTRSVLRLLL